MKVLLDTHSMFWWLANDRRLSPLAREIISDGRNRLIWSLASSWEIAVKVSVGKLTIGRPLQQLFADIVTGQGVEPLPITHDHCARLSDLPLHHRDPFDRMLVAQAQGERLPVLSADSKLSQYDIEVLW
ncbi:MAG: type II toxin-antitoxin system VapC family toxin [Thermoanaerobaculales bacterium]|nr:type II toxin-antitoxin system VapC family toxin [Thermoanaerobaculales bacterium]